jgi:DNA processing protein
MRRDLSEIADIAIDERAARIVLALACEPGDELVPQLVAAHGAVHLVRQISDGALQDETPHLARWRQDVTSRLDVAEISRVLLQTGERELGNLIPGEPGWPVLAGNPATHPLMLWTRGNASHLTSNAPRVAVIGARVPTDYGRDVARALWIDLADGESRSSGQAGRASMPKPSWVQPRPAGLPSRCSPQGWTALPQQQHQPVPGHRLQRWCPGQRLPTRTRHEQGAHPSPRPTPGEADAVVVTEGAYRCHAIKIAQEATRLNVPVGAVPGPINSVICGPRHGQPVPDRIRDVKDVSNGPGGRSAGHRLTTPRSHIPSSSRRSAV